MKLPKHFSREVVKLLKPAIQAGCTYRITTGQHVILTNPANGKTLTVAGRNQSYRQPCNLRHEIDWLLGE